MFCHITKCSYKYANTGSCCGNEPNQGSAKVNGVNFGKTGFSRPLCFVLVKNKSTMSFKYWFAS